MLYFLRTGRLKGRDMVCLTFDVEHRLRELRHISIWDVMCVHDEGMIDRLWLGRYCF